MSKADDIKDFQIEGITIGDSVLDFYSEKKIKNNLRDWFLPKYSVAVFEEQRGIYDEIQLIYKTKDKKYTIVGISALKFTDPKYCLEKINSVTVEIKDIFSKKVTTREKKTSKHPSDKSGKSTVTDIVFKLKKNKDLIIVACYDWSEKTEFWDNLRISLRTKEYDKYISR